MLVSQLHLLCLPRKRREKTRRYIPSERQDSMSSCCMSILQEWTSPWDIQKGCLKETLTDSRDDPGRGYNPAKPTITSRQPRPKQHGFVSAGIVQGFWFISWLFQLSVGWNVGTFPTCLMDSGLRCFVQRFVWALLPGRQWLHYTVFLMFKARSARDTLQKQSYLESILHCPIHRPLSSAAHGQVWRCGVWTYQEFRGFSHLSLKPGFLSPAIALSFQGASSTSTAWQLQTKHAHHGRSCEIHYGDADADKSVWSVRVKQTSFAD